MFRTGSLGLERDYVVVVVVGRGLWGRDLVLALRFRGIYGCQDLRLRSSDVPFC